MTPLTAAFPSASIFQSQLLGDRVTLRLLPDPHDGSVLILYSAPVDGSPGRLLSDPSLAVREFFQDTEDSVAFETLRGFHLSSIDEGVPFLLRPLPVLIGGEVLVRDRIFYSSRETDSPLVELYTLDVDAVRLFIDGFETGDTSRWTATVP
ncbi:MAG: hypothetical protein AAGM22_32585 [Acidobacteriota bacterium]